MTQRIIKLALLSTASTAAAVLFAPTAASAQATCTPGTATATNNVITCLDGTTTVVTGTTDLTTTVSLGTAGQGLRLTSVGDQSSVLAITGPFTTSLNPGVVATSGGAINFTSTGTLSTTGTGAAGNGYVFAPTTSLTANVGNISTSGANAFGVRTDGGTNISVTTGAITTTGGSSAPGVAVLDNTGTSTVVTGALNTAGPGVIVDNFSNAATNITTGAIVTTGPNADGVFADTNGPITVTTASVATNGLDSDGVQITTLGAVTTNTGNITTGGVDSVGLLITGGAGNVQAGYGNITTAGTGASYPVLISTTSGAINLAGGNVTTTGANQIGIELNSTSGAITGTTGSITATGAGSRGLVVNGAGGGLVNLTTGAVATANDGIVINNGADPITLVTGAVTTTEVDAPAVTLASTGAINVTTGLLTTGGGAAAGANSPGLLINGGTGAVTATVAGATTTGAGSDAISITSAGPVTVTNSGTINVSGANSVGIDVATTGTGAINVTTGSVTSTAANAAADPSFAAVRVVAAGAAPVTVVANGNITTAAGSGIWAQTAGNTNVTVNSGVTVSGPTAITLGGAGTNTLVVNGTLNSTTAGTSGYVLAPGAGALALTIGANGSISGPLTFGAGADVFTNNRAAGFTQSGALNFGAGNDTFNNTTVFTQTAAINFGDGNDTVNNTGAFNASGTIDFGAGTDTFNNGTTGTGAVAGTLTAFNGATFTNLEAFNNNAGLIDLRDGATGDILNLGTANYTATGGARLGIDVGTAGGVLTSDRLVYAGTTTGVTTILPTYLAGGLVIDPTGALVVDAGTVAAGQFVLGGPANVGLINLALETRGSDVFLTGRPDEAVADLLFVNRLGSDIWYQSAEAYQAYAMSRRVDFGNERKSPIGIWAQLYGSKERFGDRGREITAFGTALTTSNRFETKRRGAQTGIEFGAPSFLIGLTGGYEHAEGGTDFGTGIDAEGYNYGAYAQFGAPQGPYAGVLVKRDNYDVRITNSSVGALTVIPEGRSTGIDGEVGFRFGNPGGINFDVGAGLSYVRSRIEDYNFGNLSFDNERHTSTRGRLQARASFAGAVAPFIDGKLFREFGDANDLTVRSGALTTNLVDAKRGTWGRVEAGIGGGAGGGPLLSAFVDLGDVRGWGLRGGFRF